MRGATRSASVTGRVTFTAWGWGLLAALAVLLVAVTWRSPRAVSAEGAGFRVYIVQPGDSLSAIAEQSGMPLAALVELNRLDDPDRLVPGTPLVLSGAASAAHEPQAAPAAPRRYVEYQVEPGDTLWAVAEAHGIAVDELAQLNGLADQDHLRTGAVLRLPLPQAPEERAQPVRHLVAPGETLTEIADAYSVPVEAITRANRIADGNRIRAGVELVIPGGALPVPPLQVRAVVADAARTTGLDPYLLLALSYLESGWNMGAVSSTGAIGFMQLMPDTAQWVVNDLLPGPTNWRTSIVDNTRLGAAYLDHLVTLAGGDVQLALAAYYQGWASVHRDGPFADTEQYVADVMALVERFRALIADW